MLGQVSALSENNCKRQYFLHLIESTICGPLKLLANLGKLTSIYLVNKISKKK